jgi:hypothetical protein
MVIMSCQLLFIDFLVPFCHFLDPFVVFSSLKNSLVWFLSFLWDVTIHVTYGIGKLFESWVIFEGPLVKSRFSNFLHLS